MGEVHQLAAEVLDGKHQVSTEANKRTALALLQASAIHDGAKFAELMHPDATYWVIGKPHLFAYSGEQTREQICAYMATPSIFVGGVKSTIHTLTAEDDRVAVEAEIVGTLPDGRSIPTSITI